MRITSSAISGCRSTRSSDWKEFEEFEEFKEFREFKNRSQEGLGIGVDWRGAALKRVSRPDRICFMALRAEAGEKQAAPVQTRTPDSRLLFLNSSNSRTP
jgi:hypothetical protein